MTFAYESYISWAVMTKADSTLQIILTEDGSPTAYFDGFEGEKMHHSGGAFGESVYIFGPALMWAFSKSQEFNVKKPRVISAGTGLAYNEIISAAMALVLDVDFAMDSFEKDNLLNQSLRNWVLDLNEEILVEKSVYEVILKMTAQLFEVSAGDIKSLLRSKLENGDWKIHGELPPLEKFSNQHNVILYDLFSSKAMTPFWTEEYLTEFFARTAAPQCALATYACTGNLKRALKKNNFQFTQRDGYLWKRHSSFATRR